MISMQACEQAIDLVMFADNVLLAVLVSAAFVLGLIFSKKKS